MKFGAWHIDDLERMQSSGNTPYLEFLNTPTMTSGLYVIPKGSYDEQEPHAEDETYFVVKGRAKFEADGREYPARPGAYLFVQAGIDHRFVDIEEDLQLLVFFSKAKP